MRNVFLTFVAAFFVSNLAAQHVPQTPYTFQESSPNWVQLMYTNAHPLEVKAAYEAFYEEHEFVKNKDTQFYKRYLRNYQATGNGQGEVLSDSRADEAYLALRSSQARAANWEEAGPWHYDPEVAMYFEVQSPGACHVYTVEQAKSNPDVVWCGTATAGIWKSTDKGMHWDLMSKELLVTSVYSVEIDPTDESIVYFGEGNGKIWKTTDGGETWEMTGSETFQNNNKWVRDLRLKPNDSNVLFAATDDGLFRSDNGGNTYTNVSSSEHMEIEFHPTDNDVIYSVALVGNNTLFKKSTDGGMTFVSGTTGWPTIQTGEEQRRCEMSVSAASPNSIYVLASGQTEDGGGLYGIYESNDQGENFAFVCCGNQAGGPWEAGTNPNTLGWSEDGTGDGGQYYYDLALDVSPTDPARMFTGGICVWRSENGGADWSLNAHWVTWAGEFTAERYNHADVHDIKFFETEEGVDMWVASDGGLYYSADQGDNLEPRMYGLHGTDFWGWQAGFKDGDVMVGGTYHNGTHIRNGDLYHWGADSETSGGWLAELAGDNFRGFINPGDPTLGYHDGGAFRFTEDRFTRISGEPFDNSKRPNTSYWWGEYGNMEWDPRCYNYMYSPVESSLWFSKNGGASWDELNDFGGELIVSVKVAPRDHNRIYVSHKQSGSSWKIHRSSDMGNTWEEVSLTNAESGNNGNKAIYLDVDAEDPDRLWCVLIGSHNGNKVYESTNGGDTWNDLTSGVIEDEFVASIAHQRGSDGGIYIGTDRAVYYKDDNLTDWELYSASLPARTPVVFLQSYYCEGKIRAAGSRGVHESDFYEPSSVLAGFSADRLELNLALNCVSDPIRFTDLSVVTCNDVQYEWTFEGGTADANDQETVFVTYSEPGTYDVTLTVTDEEGNSNTYTVPDMITVTSDPIPMPIAEDFNGAFPPEHWKLEGNFGNWEHAFELGDDSNGVAQYPNYWVDGQGEADLLIMPAMDFSDVEDPLLFFDVSYQLYADYIDGLEVYYKIGDQEEWSTVYSKFGEELAVDDNYVWFWYDQGGDLLWRTDSVNLAPLANEECVTIAFANISDYGNHIWLDNVNLTTYTEVGIQEVPSSSELAVYPNPTNGAVVISTPATWNGESYQVLDMSGRVVATGTLSQRNELDLQHVSDGLYVLQVQNKGAAVKILKRQ